MSLQHVILQLLPRREFNLAEFADRRLLVDLLYVSLENCLGGELHEAVLAAMEFGGDTVESHVTVENCAVDEGFRTHSAGVLLVPRVRCHVNCAGESNQTSSDGNQINSYFSAPAP
jgi:hypothetical protein